LRERGASDDRGELMSERALACLRAGSQAPVRRALEDAPAATPPPPLAGPPVEPLTPL
jgi:hypothetical protein